MAIAERLSTEGASVVIADIDSEAASATAMRIGPALGVCCDVSDEASVAACVALTLDRFGSLDIVTNNAGLMTFAGLESLTKADWMKVIEVDLIGAALFTRQIFTHAGERGGVIVNVSSVHAFKTTANVAPYAAAKAALLSLTRSSAIEGKPHRIRANAVVPGAIDSVMLRSNPNLRSGSEILRPEDIGQPSDIAAAIAFLASNEARFVTGSVLTVDGGRLAQL